jgi:hypothetical protein
VSDGAANVTTIARTSRHDTAGFNDGSTHDKLVAQHAVNAAVIDMLFAPATSSSSSDNNSSGSSSSNSDASAGTCASNSDSFQYSYDTVKVLVHMYLEIGEYCVLQGCSLLCTVVLNQLVSLAASLNTMTRFICQYCPRTLNRDVLMLCAVVAYSAVSVYSAHASLLLQRYT